MSVQIISGEEAGRRVRDEISAALENLPKKRGAVPGLAVLVAGGDPASLAAAECLEKLGEELGFYVEVRCWPADGTAAEIGAMIHKLNKAALFHGLFCPRPLPRHLPEKEILTMIAPAKDVGARHPLHAGKLFCGRGGYLPLQADGCWQALRSTGRPVSGKSAVLLDPGHETGKPLAVWLLYNNATVTLCPAGSEALPDICRSADILVTELGKPGSLQGDWIKPGAVVIDAAAARRGEAAAGDDAVLAEVRAAAGWFFSLPAGEMDPLFQIILLKNTLEAFKQSIIQ